MMIGYASELNEQTKKRLIAAGATQIETKRVEKKTDIQNFEKFLLENRKNDIILENINGIGVTTLIQLAPSLSIIEKYQIKITFLDKSIGGVEILGDFLETIRGIIRHDERGIRTRTKKGLEKAKSAGVVGGRPRLAPEIVGKIRFLHHDKKMPAKEISEECQVSIGTVYTYIK